MFSDIILHMVWIFQYVRLNKDCAITTKLLRNVGREAITAWRLEW